MTNSRHLAVLAAIMFWLLPLASPAEVSDADEITQLLQAFLAAADERAAHEQFWAEDLVYTSSAGQRYGKADILAGFDGDDQDAADDDAGAAISYVGDEVDVRVYGNTAIVAFKLVGRPEDGSEALYYYNTGTFLKRGGEWQVVAWQATRIPPDAYQ